MPHRASFAGQAKETATSMARVYTLTIGGVPDLRVADGTISYSSVSICFLKIQLLSDPADQMQRKSEYLLPLVLFC